MEVDDLDGAIAVAAVGADPRHAATPDRMTITGADGKLHYCGIVGSEAVSEGRQ
ncbi:hypothetical protein [Mesorhizobium sp.]|uniref:hypothetical protein n=1 Tax=Mesorhizobium sp. TaxID=1871066 RepID=UPI0025BD302A|nr:hypothetical protein [Mesorhizobium sp.]